MHLFYAFLTSIALAPLALQAWTATVLSESPRIVQVDGFLSDGECEYMMMKSRPNLQRSTVVDENAVETRVAEGRSSYGTWYGVGSDWVVRNIEARIAEITQWPVNHGEGIQVLRYGKGGEYRPHHDYFDTTSVGGAHQSMWGGQRIVSFLMYLNDVNDGGETFFPLLNIKIQPKRGRAMFFYNMTPDWVEDPLTLHGGAPVGSGEKWLATKWIRLQPTNVRVVAQTQGNAGGIGAPGSPGKPGEPGKPGAPGEPG